MYSIGSFAQMIRDQARVTAYKRALDSVLQPDSVVLDLGAGSGVFALYAASRGVRKVYAVEENAVLKVGRSEAQRLGLADRIEFFIGRSQDFVPAEPATVLTFDLRGSLPFMPGARAAIEDARTRLLAPGGNMVPQYDDLYVTPFSGAEWYRRTIEQPWTENLLGLTLSASRELQSSAVHGAPSTLPSGMLPGQHWGTLDYRTGRDWFATEPLEWQVEHPTEFHALLTWFECQLADNVRMSAAPGADAPKVYGRLMLPLQQPVRLLPGERLQVKVSASEIAQAVVFRWHTTVYDRQGQQRLALVQHSMGEVFLAASKQLR